jgi:hypothetical protein
MRPSGKPLGVAAVLRVLVIAAMMMCGLIAGPSHALAQSLDAARASGMVGERFDGYAVARDNATPAVRSLVASVNSQRGKIYAKRAAEQKIPAAEVGKFYASQIVTKAPKGTWFLSSSGAWSRR